MTPSIAFDEVVGNLPGTSDPEDSCADEKCAASIAQHELEDKTSRVRHASLDWALRRGEYRLVLDMLSQGKLPSIGNVAWAIKHCPKHVVTALLDSGLDINQQLNDSYPPPLAMTFGDIQITKMFLERNANPNARCKFDITPFSLAVQEAPIEIIQLLFEHGASINAGQPLHYAVRRKSNDRSVVIQSLISKGACVNAVMFQDHLPSFYHFESLGLGTALHSAARYGDRQAVQLLLESGADPSIKDTRNQLPIQLARLGNHMEIVKMLEGWVDRGQRL